MVFYSLLTNKKIVLAPLLAAILAAGLLFINPTSITNAQAQMYNDGYGDRYSDDSYYKDYDRYDYDSHTKKSPDVSVQELECVNSDVNVNGIDLTKIQDPTTWGAESGLAANEADGPDGANGNGLGDSINVDRNLVNICVNYNQNEQVKGPTNGEPPEPRTGNLLVGKIVTCEPGEVNGNGFTSIQQVPPDPCDELRINITSSDFGISMTGNEPVVPTSFLGSQTGQNVLLGVGPYTVTETPDASVAANVTALEAKYNVLIDGPIPAFDGDCTQSATNEFAGTGTMTEGASQTCEITNNFQWFDETVDKVTFCHCPDGQGGFNCQTKTLPQSAVEAHLEEHEFDTNDGVCTSQQEGPPP